MRMRCVEVALGHAAADATLHGRPRAWPRCMKCLPRGVRARRRPGFIAGLAGRVTPRRPLVWVRQDFSEIESGALSMSGLCELGLDPRLRRDRARRRCRYRVADRRRRAGLRCARRRRAGGLGAGAAARSRRQPQADIGRAGLRRHRVCCCGWRRSRSPRPRRPDGSCARRIRRRQHCGAHGARRCSTRSSFVTVMARSAGGSWNGNVMSAFSANRRRILSLWLPRLPIDRIKRQLAPNSAALDNDAQRRRRQAKQRAADLRARRCRRALRPRDRPAARQCPRDLSRI